MKAFAVFCLLIVAAVFLVSQSSPPREQVGPARGGGFLLNSGWRCKPAGRQVRSIRFRCRRRCRKDGKYLLVLNGGYKPPSISVLQRRHHAGD